MIILLFVGHLPEGMDFDYTSSPSLLLILWFLLFFLFNFIYFLAALGLHCCVWAFSSCSEHELLFIAVSGLLIVVASFAAEHRL